jgi:hypothetical protein
MTWDAIIEEWHGRITRAAIADAVRLASKAFHARQDKMALGSAGE